MCFDAPGRRCRWVQAAAAARESCRVIRPLTQGRTPCRTPPCSVDRLRFRSAKPGKGFQRCVHRRRQDSLRNACRWGSMGVGCFQTRRENFRGKFSRRLREGSAELRQELLFVARSPCFHKGRILTSVGRASRAGSSSPAPWWPRTPRPMPSDGAGTSRDPLIRASNVAIAHPDGAAVCSLRPPVTRRSLRRSEEHTSELQSPM